MRAGRRMVRANGQRDGVGKTRDWASAFEHSRPMLDSTRVSPYGPAAREMPQSMRPDTRQHLTACTGLSEEQNEEAQKRLAFGEASTHAQSPINHRRSNRSERACAATTLLGTTCGSAASRTSRGWSDSSAQVPERVRHGRDPEVLEHLGKRRYGYRRPAPHGKHKLADARRSA